MLSQTRILFLVATLATASMSGREWTEPGFPHLNATEIFTSADPSDDDRIWRAEEVDQRPQPINYQQVKGWIGYPETAYKSGIQGDVILRILVDERGEYQRHEVVDSFHPLLRIPCEVFTQLMVFKPAMIDGEAVACWAEVAYHFEIPDYGK
jgi:hypothetical protein